MSVLDTILEILQTKRLSPEMERRLDAMLWSREFDEVELAALRELESLLENGVIHLG
ncbi:MAG: hypothetical protein J7641_04595 [Cyanobacteria bacterium SID2]|nr:hypothetical protein [Cyanobacteria bacterium SID2]MBP0004327.1 hypothetical protein [Cyanobacteria bacterium SBC]